MTDASRYREAPDALYNAANLVAVNAEARGAWQLRPPMHVLQDAGTLGTLTGRKGQSIYEHVRLDGTVDRFFFVGGKMYSWDGNTSAPTISNITPGTVTISATARIFLATFGDRLIVTDGVNQPWSYDPAATTTALIGYDTSGGGTAWTAFGCPAVFGAKLFWVVNTIGGTAARSTFIWSEEADPATGYAQTGGARTYTNTWRFAQTDTRPIYGLAATNTDLYIFRARSIAKVSGLVNAAFQTTASHDSISGVGTTTPASIMVYAGYIWFIDEDGRPYRIAEGGVTAEPLWKQLTDRLRPGGTAYLAVPGTQTSAGFTTYCPEYRKVLMAVWEGVGSGSGKAVTWFSFDADTGRYEGVWYYGNNTNSTSLVEDMAAGTLMADAGGVMRDASGNLTLLLLGSLNSSTTAHSGAVVRQRYSSEVNGSSILWNDNGTGGNNIVEHCMTTHYVFPPSDAERLIDTVSMGIRSPLAFNVSYEIAVLRNTTSTLRLHVPSQISTATTDTESRIVAGVNEMCRWARLRFRYTTNGLSSNIAPFVVEDMYIDVGAGGHLSRAP